ncbi:MAG TPA: ATP-binding cassette domain-containing protein [Acidimicrobiia bacterium]|nr:ATP-binding cassette domain-containing protein [Acidimicrobiia bacterium]
MDSVRLLRSFSGANRRLTVVVVAAGALRGLLFPLFTLATGALVASLQTDGSVVWPAVAVAVTFLVARLLDPVLEEAGQALWRQVDEALSQRLMRAVLASPGLTAVESPAVRDSLVQAQGDLTDLTPGQAAYHLGRVVTLVVQGVGSLVIVAVYQWWVAALLAVGYLAANRVYRQHWLHVTLVLMGRTDRLRRAYYLRGLAIEPESAKETRIFGLTDWLVDGYRQRWMREMGDIWQTRNEGWVASVVVIAALAAAEGLAVGLVAVGAADGRVPLGRAVAVAGAVLGAAVLGTYTEGHWMLGECARAITRIEAVEAETTAGVQPGGTTATHALPRRAIRFEGVRFAYPAATRPVFDCLDLEIEAGRSLAIVGENGAGKTTLVKLLCRLYDPDAGRITIDGVDLRGIDPESWHTRVAAVFQDHVQFELSAYDNVAYGALDNRADADAVRAAADLAGALDIVDRLPRGWDTPLSREFSEGTQLSGGEWQRLALARALFAVRSGAGVLVLDEPTAALDVRGEAEVYERFLELTRGVTTVVISHRFSTVRRADRIVVVDQGRVVEDGSHEELVAAGGHYAAMYWLQANRFSEGPEHGA